VDSFSRGGPWGGVAPAGGRALGREVHQPDEGRHGVHFQLGHHLLAVGLDRGLAQPQLSGNLLVEKPPRHEVTHLRLSWGEAGKTRPRVHPALCFLFLPGVLGEGSREGGAEVLLVGGLGEKVDGAGAHGLHRVGNLPCTADENHRRLAWRLVQGALELEPVHVGHFQVHKDTRRAFRDGMGEKVRRGDEGLGGDARGAQEAHEGGADDGVVVDEENLGAFGNHARPASRAARRRRRRRPERRGRSRRGHRTLRASFGPSASAALAHNTAAPTRTARGRSNGRFERRTTTVLDLADSGFAKSTELLAAAPRARTPETRNRPGVAP
jgi:hypothetical protein